MRRSGCGTAFVRPKSLRGIWFDSRPTTFMRGRLTGKARFSVDGRRLSKKTAAGSSPAPAIYVGSSKKGPLLSPTGGAPPSGRWEIGRAAPVTRWVDAGSIPARRTNKRGLPKMSAAPSIKNPTRFIDNPVEAIGSDPTRIAFIIINKTPKSSRSSSAVERWWENHQRLHGSTPAFYILWPSSPNNGGQWLAYDIAEPLGIEAVTVDSGESGDSSDGSIPSSADSLCGHSSNGRAARVRFVCLV